MPFVSHMVATPSDWRERTIPSHEKSRRTRKEKKSRAHESGEEAKPLESSWFTETGFAKLAVLEVSIVLSYPI
jgi:hypothetical protein